MINRELHFQSLKEKDGSLYFGGGMAHSNPQTSKMAYHHLERNPFEVADFEEDLAQQRQTVR